MKWESFFIFDYLINISFNYNTMADFETSLACHMLVDAEKEVIGIGYEKIPYEGLSQMQFIPKREFY